MMSFLLSKKQLIPLPDSEESKLSLNNDEAKLAKWSKQAADQSLLST